MDAQLLTWMVADVDAQLVISVVAVGLATLASIMTATALRRTTAREDYNSLTRQHEELKGTVISMQRDLEDCKRARDAFEDKNFQLLQELYDLRKKVDDL